jgi:hypothetical protein
MAMMGLLIGLAGCGGDGNNPPAFLNPVGRGLSAWTYQAGRIAETLMNFPLDPPSRPGIAYGLNLYYTVSGATSSGYMLTFFSDASHTDPAGSATVTISPGGSASLKTLTINENIFGNSTRIQGQATVTYNSSAGPVGVNGALTATYSNGQSNTFNIDMTLGASGRISGGITTRAPKTTASLNNLTLQSDRALIGSFSATATAVAGTLTVNPDLSGTLSGIDPSVGHYNVVWTTTGEATISYPDVSNVVPLPWPAPYPWWDPWWW